MSNTMVGGYQLLDLVSMIGFDSSDYEYIDDEYNHYNRGSFVNNLSQYKSVIDYLKKTVKKGYLTKPIFVNFAYSSVGVVSGFLEFRNVDTNDYSGSKCLVCLKQSFDTSDEQYGYNGGGYLLIYMVTGNDKLFITRGEI